MAMKQYNKVVWPGFSNAPSPRNVPKVKRNDSCPCGSGKKYKVCHESEGSAFLAKLAQEDEKKRRKEVREQLREQGVPWYKRLFFLS